MPVPDCRFSSISRVAAFHAKFIFNVYSDFAVINYSPLKIRCFFGFTAMPQTRRRRRRVLPVVRSEDPSQLQASGIQSNSPLSTPKQCFLPLYKLRVLPHSWCRLISRKGDQVRDSKPVALSDQNWRGRSRCLQCRKAYLTRFQLLAGLWRAELAPRVRKNHINGKYGMKTPKSTH
jgi:hypothetical protein